MSLTIALLLDGRSLQGWESRAVSHLLNSDLDTTVSVVVVNDAEQSASPSVTGKISRFARDFSPWKCLVAMRMIRHSVVGKPWYRKRVPLDEVIDISETTAYQCVPEPAEDFGNTLPDRIVSALEEVDIAIRFGFGILKGDALTAPTYGVLSYHHGDFSEYRGRPAGFYEFIHGRSTAGVTVQQLSEDLDGGTVAATAECDIEDASSRRVVLERQFTFSEPLLTEAVQNLVDEQLPEQPETLGTLYSTPDGRDIITYLKTSAIRRLS